MRMISALSISAQKKSGRRLIKGDLRFIDDETREVLNVTVTEEALRAYQKQSELHTKGLESLCRTYGIAYLPVHVEDGIEQVLFHQMARKNWIK